MDRRKTEERREKMPENTKIQATPSLVWLLLMDTNQSKITEKDREYF